MSVKRKRLLWQLLPSYLLITIVSLVAVTWYAGFSWKKFYLDQTAHDLEAWARLVENQLPGQVSEASGPRIDETCKHLGKITATRLTVILPSGMVLGDSDEDPARMENHADRPEFQDALKGRVGVRTRYSHTLQKDLMYVALPLIHQDHIRGVVRASLPVPAIDAALKGVYWQVGLGGLVIAVLAAFLSLAAARRLNRPLEEMKRGAARFARGDLNRLVPVPETEELASLAEALNSMAAQLDDRIRTITRQRQEREAMLASMVEGVMAVDSEKRLIALNRAGAQLLGVNAEEVQQRRLAEVISNRDLQGLVTRTLAFGQPLEEEVLLRDGEERILQVHGAPLQDPEGSALGAVIVFHDVTRLRKLENARREFVANAAHELKTPVTAIKGFVETLLDGALREPENALKFLQIMARQADLLQAIIEDLLSLSRLEADSEEGRIPLSSGKIKDVLDSALQTCEARAAKKGIRLVLSCPENLKAMINAPLLEQAVVNLIDNAVKYSQPESTVALEAQPEEGEIVIRVRDQGAGIPAEHLPRLFERFYRVDPGRSRKIGGTGLGLAIVKHIAQAHGGKVTVESAPGQGSVFSLHLLPG
jgi:two-component system phosphate regulon sensor histidine kinase PhoR